MENPDKVFKDIMRFSRQQEVPPEVFDSRSDLVRYLERNNEKLRTGKGRNSIDFMMEHSSQAQELVTTKQERTVLEVLRRRKPKVRVRRAKGVRQELQRSNRARLLDERRTSNLLPDTAKAFLRWRKNPERFDFRGVDTETHKSIKDFIAVKTEEKRRQGFRVFNDRDVHVFVVERKNNRVFAKNIVTGRFVPKVAYTKFGRLKDLVNKK